MQLRLLKLNYLGDAISGGDRMPTLKTGPDKFGIEHEIKNEKGSRQLTDEELREKAKLYTEKGKNR
ncbi:MAG: hypothetical protein K0R55_3614 [Sporomusa sp.]|jgi:hypothetical protein|nr:hypothetical protein [Sporomusa sp.]